MVSGGFDGVEFADDVAADNVAADDVAAVLRLSVTDCVAVLGTDLTRRGSTTWGAR